MSKDSRHNKTSESLNQAFNDLLKEYDIENKFQEARIINSWEKLMGKPISNRTEKIFIDQKTLVIKLTSAPLKQELQLSKKKILNLFEAEFGNGVIEDIRFY